MKLIDFLNQSLDDKIVLDESGVSLVNADLLNDFATKTAETIEELTQLIKDSESKVPITNRALEMELDDYFLDYLSKSTSSELPTKKTAKRPFHRTFANASEGEQFLLASGYNLKTCFSSIAIYTKSVDNTLKTAEFNLTNFKLKIQSENV